MRCRQLIPGRRFDVLLHYGEDINEALLELARDEQIETAVITAGLGGFDRFSLQYPEGQDQWSGCVLQLAAVQGVIEGGLPRVHAVVTLDGRDGITRAGRCGSECRRLFYCELMVQELLPADEG